MATGLTDQDRRRIKDALDHSVSANTRGMYAYAWRSFEERAQARGVPVLPDSPELVAAYPHDDFLNHVRAQPRAAPLQAVLLIREEF